MTRPTRRQGPRPLPVHLASAATAWTTSRAALPLLKRGSLPWRPELAGAADALRRSLAEIAPEDFADAVDRELRARADAFLSGIERYRAHPYRRAAAEAPVLWHEGSTRLLDYGAGAHDGRAVLVVPSLINRAYILDLTQEKSLLRFLAGQGLRPLLVDWGRPSGVERGFTLSDYIAGRLEAAAAAAVDVVGRPLGVVGYCMGGLLALALAQRRPPLVKALALLATPWDFHAERAGQARLLGALAEPLSRSFGALGELPVDVLQLLFAGLDPLLALRKFIRLAGLPKGSVEERDFVAMEDWLNDGVPLALPTARECLAQWYGANAPAAGGWRVAGVPIEPARLRQPSLVVVPAQDRIVPPASAAALAAALPRAESLAPALGHIGMMVARNAPDAVWRPLAAWLARHAAKH
jgi:poly[(R)-3-hydroxyalkanoate] polymerase subunit PhaC